MRLQAMGFYQYIHLVPIHDEKVRAVRCDSKRYCERDDARQ